MEQKNWINTDMEFVLNQIKENAKTFVDTVPGPTSENLVYSETPNAYWTSSFWLGILFLAKEGSKSNDFDEVISKQVASFQNRLDKRIELETHDIGFLYTLSGIADYKVNGNDDSKKMAVQAADLLMGRYHEKAKVFQAWDEEDDDNVRMIIDCLMNLPLLYFASNVTGDEKYKKAAYEHAKQTQKYIVRDDYSTYHTYYFNRKTGEPVKGETAQGYKDDSSWARGQAWGIYGFTLSYLYTGDYTFLDTAIEIADYFIERLPSDNVAYWDLYFNDGSGQERDSSAATIAACGLLELAKNLPISNTKKEFYEENALKMMKSLGDKYTTKNLPHSNGLLQHGVYDKNKDKGVDECTIWGDYFYVEALLRLSSSWYMYW